MTSATSGSFDYLLLLFFFSSSPHYAPCRHLTTFGRWPDLRARKVDTLCTHRGACWSRTEMMVDLSERKEERRRGRNHEGIGDEISWPCHGEALYIYIEPSSSSYSLSCFLIAPNHSISSLLSPIPSPCSSSLFLHDADEYISLVDSVFIRPNGRI